MESEQPGMHQDLQPKAAKPTLKVTLSSQDHLACLYALEVR